MCALRHKLERPQHQGISGLIRVQLFLIKSTTFETGLGSGSRQRVVVRDPRRYRGDLPQHLKGRIFDQDPVGEDPTLTEKVVRQENPS